MIASIIRQLLSSKPFVSFRLHSGFEMEFPIDDPQRCRLDEEEMILYVSCPAVLPPKMMRQMRPLEPATVEIIDLRHVSRVTVNSEMLPGKSNRKSAAGNRK